MWHVLCMQVDHFPPLRLSFSMYKVGRPRFLRVAPVVQETGQNCLPFRVTEQPRAPSPLFLASQVMSTVHVYRSRGTWSLFRESNSSPRPVKGPGCVLLLASPAIVQSPIIPLTCPCHTLCQSWLTWRTCWNQKPQWLTSGWWPAGGPSNELSQNL